VLLVIIGLVVCAFMNDDLNDHAAADREAEDSKRSAIRTP